MTVFVCGIFSYFVFSHTFSFVSWYLLALFCYVYRSSAMSSSPIVDEEIQSLRNMVIKLEQEKIELARRLHQKEVKLLEKELCNDTESDSDDLYLSDEYDSDVDEDCVEMQTEMEVDNLRHLFQVAKRDAEEQKTRYEEQINENSLVIKDLRHQIKGLQILKEQEEAIKKENETLKSTIQRLLTQHQLEVAQLNQRIIDAKDTSEKVQSLERSVVTLSKERDALKAKVYKLESDDGGRKLSGSSEAYELVQLRKTNEMLLGEINTLHDALNEETGGDRTETALVQCLQIVNDCIEGEWVNHVCPLCNRAIPGKDCDLCAAFQRIVRLKEEKQKAEKGHEEKDEIQDGNVPVLMLAVVVVVILIIIACWFLSFLSCSKNNCATQLF